MSTRTTAIPAGVDADNSLLQVDDLRVGVRSGGMDLTAVAGVSFRLGSGEILGLAGESGCGKTLTALAIAGLLPPAASAGGAVRLGGTDLLAASPAKRRSMAGKDIGFVFQEPMSALHPVLTIGRQMDEGMRAHLNLTKAQRRARAVDLLGQVGIPRPRSILDSRIGQLSGGMRQRVMIAMAIACDPRMLVADEPTTALDVTLQAQILALLLSLRDELELSILMITHDLGVVRQVCDSIAVMYAGQIVEHGNAATVLSGPAHHYTAGLLDAVPRLGDTRDRLPTIPGRVPDLDEMPAGCRFAPRCPRAAEDCARGAELTLVSAGHDVRCRYPIGQEA